MTFYPVCFFKTEWIVNQEIRQAFWFDEPHGALYFCSSGEVLLVIKFYAELSEALQAHNYDTIDIATLISICLKENRETLLHDMPSIIHDLEQLGIIF